MPKLPVAQGSSWQRKRQPAKGEKIYESARYVFVDTENPRPRRIVGEVRKIAGVVRADAPFGVPDVIALVEGEDVAKMGAAIDQIAEIKGMLDTESKVVRWV